MARCVFGLNEQLVHNLFSRNDHPEFAAEAVDAPQHVLDRRGIDVLATDDEHIVVAAINAVGQPRDCPSEWTATVNHPVTTIRRPPNNRLKCTLDVLIYRLLL